MFKKISLLVFLSVPLIILADHHGMKGDKSPKDIEKMEMMKKKKDHMKNEMERRGMWKPEDCKKISQTSGAYLYFSGEAFKKRSAFEKDGNKIAADEAFSESRALAELAANFAKNFETYCKR